MRAYWLLLFCATCTTLPSKEAATPNTEPPAAHQIVSLLSYVEKDYGGAVTNGVVQDAGEWEEQKAFIGDMVESAQGLPKETSPLGGDVVTRLRAIGAQIEAKEKEELVASSCRSLKNDIIKTFGLTLSPSKPLRAGKGAELYGKMCADCHGQDGMGQTKRRAQLKVPPASFHDDAVVGPLSPYRAFDILSFGVGEMPSYELIPAEDRWDLAFYVLALRHQGKNTPAEIFAKLPESTPKTAATLAKVTDKELQEQLSASGLTQEEQEQALRVLRVVAPYTLLDASESLSTARRLLKQSQEALDRGDTEAAYDAALRSYLEGFEGVELKLKARDVELVVQAESQNLQLRAALKANDLQTAEKLFVGLEATLDRAERLLSDHSGSFAFAVFASLIILLREGIEAALIIAALLALLGKLERADAKRYVHAGWLGALVVGGASFILVQGLLSLSGTSRDLIEGVIALFASIVMFFTSYWLISKSEAQRWVAFLRKSVEGKLTSGNLLSLAGVAFLAVYREALETMLFYQALILDPTVSSLAVLVGVLIGVLGLVVAIWIMFKVGKKLPIQRFFGISGLLLYVMAVIFAAAGLHELQEIGYVPSIPVTFIRIELLGVYPDAVTLGVQFAFILAAIFAFFLLFKHQTNIQKTH